MQDRFKFNAIVSSYYDIDTPDYYEEFEPTFYLRNVDVFCTQEIGIDYDRLFDTVKEQSKNLTDKEIGQIMQHFEDNSNSPDCDFVTITPDKIIQCTGLKDGNGKRIYEGDILNIGNGSINGSVIEKKRVVKWDINKWNVPVWVVDKPDFSHYVEVIGNVYENSELLESEEK